MKRILLLLLLLSAVLTGTAQQDRCSLQISLLTCTPGEELYSTFGHTAIRVKDSLNDWVFNYGTFSFDDPDFYMKFVRGKLNYFLSVEQFSDFEYAYRYEKRGITEQSLSLSCAEKDALFRALIRNSEEANRNYKYDFLFDNCTTRAGKIIRANAGASLQFRTILPQEKLSFRDMIHSYLRKANQSWSETGIDILLGSRIDRQVTNEEAILFLPDYLMKGMDSSSKDGQAFINRSAVIVPAPPLSADKPVQPLLVFGLLLAIIAALSFVSNKTIQNLISGFDHLFFTVLGLLGLLLLFMWFGTDHWSCAANYNLLWAFPLHGIFIWFRKSAAIRQLYFRGVALLTLVLCLGWFFMPQELPLAMLPVAALIALRAFRISR